MACPGANQVHAASHVPIPQGGNDATGVDQKWTKSFEEKKIDQVKQQPSALTGVILRPAKK